MAGIAAAEDGTAAVLGKLAEVVLAAGLLGLPGNGKLLETGTAEAAGRTVGALAESVLGAGAGTAQGIAGAALLELGQMAQTGQNHQSPGCLQTVALIAGPFGSRKIQRPASVVAQLDRQTGRRKWRLKTGSRLSPSLAAGQKR